MNAMLKLLTQHRLPWLCPQLIVPGVVLACCLSVPSVCSSQQGRLAQTYRQPDRLYRIDVEDSDEAALVEQVLKIKLVLLRGNVLYFYGNAAINRRLMAYGYKPVGADPDKLATRVIRIAKRGDEQTLRALVVRIILREREAWVVRATLDQMRILPRRGYSIAEIGNKEPAPRRIRIVVSRRSEVARIGGAVEIDSVRQDQAGYLVVIGEAFDDAIDDLIARNFKVEILPDFPGVIR